MRFPGKPTGKPNTVIGASKEEIRAWAEKMRVRKPRRYFFPRPSKEETFKMKLAVIERDGNDIVCYWCQASFPKQREGRPNFFYATLEHIVPIYLGGKHELHNCTLACQKCNNERRYKNDSE